MRACARKIEECGKISVKKTEREVRMANAPSVRTFPVLRYFNTEFAVIGFVPVAGIVQVGAFFTRSGRATLHCSPDLQFAKVHANARL